MECRGFKDLISDEEGMGTVEIILIIVVLIGLVIIFRTQIQEVVNNIFKKITDRTDNF
jgi:Flp pilus assembly pilin Flp